MKYQKYNNIPMLTFLSRFDDIPPRFYTLEPGQKRKKLITFVKHRGD